MATFHWIQEIQSSFDQNRSKSGSVEFNFSEQKQYVVENFFRVSSLPLEKGEEKEKCKEFRAEDIRDERPPSLSNLLPLFEGFVAPYWKVSRLSAFWSGRDGSPGKPTVEFQFAPECVKSGLERKSLCVEA